MNTSNISRWVTAATNVAVLLGVILLIAELQQNAELARQQMLQGRIGQFQDIETAMFDPDLSAVWMKSITRPESMTLAEIRMIDAYLAIHMAQMIREHEMEKAGLVEEGSTASLLAGELPWLFGNRFAQAWWKQWQHAWSSDLVELANPYIESAERDYIERGFLQLQESLREESSAQKIGADSPAP